MAAIMLKMDLEVKRNQLSNIPKWNLIFLNKTYDFIISYMIEITYC